MGTFIVDVKGEERRNTFAAFFTLLAITTGHTMLETARDALFLAKIPASHLPWMYLVIVVAAVGLAQISRFGVKLDDKRSIAVVLVAAAAVTTAFWGASQSPTPLLLYGLYVWTGLFASWVTVQFWTLIGGAFDFQQSKRLFGFIGAGAVLGGVFGAVGMRFVLMMMSPRAALLVAAGFFVLAAVPTLAVRVPAAEEEPAPLPRGDGEAAPMTAGLGLLWQNAFARRVLGIVLVSTVTVTLADYVFKAVVAYRIHDAHELAAVFSTFYAVTNTIGLVAQIVVAPWVFRTIGVQRALFFFPAAMMLAAGGVVATAATAAGLMGAVVLLKGLDGVTRYSLHRTSMELLLVPVPDYVRERIKPLIDLIGSRGGQALASIGILFLVMTNAGKPKVLGAIVLTLAVVWLSLVVTIRTLYLDVFRETLKSGGLDAKAELPALDLDMLETLFAGLNSTRDGEVLASLELLAEQHRERLIPALILYHPSRDVVLRALEIFSQMKRTDFVPIADRLDGHPDREVAAAALRARTAVLPDEKLLRAKLDGPCLQVSATALISLMARGWMEKEEAEERLKAVFQARRPAAIAEMARAIRDVAAGEGGPLAEMFDTMLLKIAERAATIAQDPEFASHIHADDDRVAKKHPLDIEIRLEVARAMAARKNPAFVAPLIGMLSRVELRSVARSALLAIPGALEALDRAMDNPEVPREARVQVPRAMTVFEAKLAAPLLARHLAVETDGSIRYRILRALVKLRRQDPGVRLEESPLHRIAEQTLDHAAELRRWRDALVAESDEPPSSLVAADPLRAAHHLLVDLVRDKEVHATERLFMLLELLYHEDFEDIWRGLRSKRSKSRASSLELIENVVKPPLRARVLGLVGDVGSRRSSPSVPVRTPEKANEPEVAYEVALREIAAKGGSTMRTLAQYRAAELGIDLGDAVQGRTSDAGELAATLGQRLVDRAREILATPPPTGPRHAPS